MDIGRKKIIIFCQSYGEIENCLYLVKKNHAYNNSITVVIPGNQDLFIFLKKINQRIFSNTIDLIFFRLFKSAPANRKGLTIKWTLRYFADAIKEKTYNRKIYNRYLNHLKYAEIYFFTRSFVPYNLYFLKKLRKNNKLIYMHISGTSKGYGEGISKCSPHNILDILNLLRLKFLYGNDIIMAKLPHIKFAYISDNFMKIEIDRIIAKEESSELLQNFDYNEFKIFDTGNYSVIYFDQSLSDRDYILDINVFRKELNAVFDILKKYFSENEIAIKYHPGYAGNKTWIKTGVVLDTFIPAELLYSDNVKMYLAIASYSIANVRQGLAVSLLDLISFRDNDTREKLRKSLIAKSHSNILFPRSLEEFENIVIPIHLQKQT